MLKLIAQLRAQATGQVRIWRSSGHRILS